MILLKKLRELRISSIFPKHCAYCDRLIPGDKSVCNFCSENLPRITGEICHSCGLAKNVCTCKGRDNYFKSIAAPFYYKGDVRKGLHIYKFRHSVSNAEAFSQDMADVIKRRFDGITFDYITEVPMTLRSKKTRGYNQTALLAKKTGEKTGVEYKPAVLSKIYETEKQHGLSAVLRKGNLAGAFDVTNPADVRDKTVLLCDDISTSGETLNECAKMMWLNGASEVYCITLAITAPVKKQKG